MTGNTFCIHFSISILDIHLAGQGTNSCYESRKLSSVINNLTLLPPISDFQISFLIWSAGWGSLWARHHSCLRSEKFGPKLAQCSTGGYYYQRWTFKSDKRLIFHFGNWHRGDSYCDQCSSIKVIKQKSIDGKTPPPKIKRTL